MKVSYFSWMGEVLFNFEFINTLLTKGTVRWEWDSFSNLYLNIHD